MFWLGLHGLVLGRLDGCIGNDMSIISRFVIMSALILLVGCDDPAYADNHLTDTRCCVAEIARNADGSIKRNRAVVRAFERLYPLPEKYNRNDWQIDHVIPLAVGGIDAVINLQWLPKTIKTCADDDCKDRWERNGIYTRSH